MDSAEIGSINGINKLVDIESIEDIDRRNLTPEQYIEIYKKSQSKKKGNKRDVYKESNPKKLVKYPVTELTGFNAARVETIYYDAKGKKIAYTRLLKRKPYTIQSTLSTNRKKNPNKVIMSSIGRYPDSKQVYYYSNNPQYVYITKGHDMIQLEWEEFYESLLYCLGHTYLVPDLWEKFLNSDYRLQHIAKSPLPHYKLKDWSHDKSVIPLDINQMEQVYKQKLDENKSNQSKWYDNRKNSSVESKA